MYDMYSEAQDRLSFWYLRCCWIEPPAGEVMVLGDWAPAGGVTVLGDWAPCRWDYGPGGLSPLQVGLRSWGIEPPAGGVTVLGDWAPCGWGYGPGGLSPLQVGLQSWGIDCASILSEWTCWHYSLHHSSASYGIECPHYHNRWTHIKI